MTPFHVCPFCIEFTKETDFGSKCKTHGYVEPAAVVRLRYKPDERKEIVEYANG